MTTVSVDKLYSVGRRVNEHATLLEWYWQRKTEVFGTEISQCNLSITNMTLIVLGLKPGLRGERQATNRLSYGMASLINLTINHVHDGVNFTTAMTDSGWKFVLYVFLIILPFPFRRCKTSALYVAPLNMNKRNQQQISQTRDSQLLLSFHISRVKPVINLRHLNISITVYSVCNVCIHISKILFCWGKSSLMSVLYNSRRD